MKFFEKFLTVIKQIFLMFYLRVKMKGFDMMPDYARLATPDKD